MKKAKIWDARQLPAFLTPKEYSALMGIDPKTVQRMCRTGQLPAHKEGPRLWRWRGRKNSNKKGPPVLEHRRASR